MKLTKSNQITLKLLFEGLSLDSLKGKKYTEKYQLVTNQIELVFDMFFFVDLLQWILQSNYFQEKSLWQ